MGKKYRNSVKIKVVYKRYIKRNGKLCGPYYYKSYRDKNGRVISRYLPNHRTFKRPKWLILFLLALSFFIFFLIAFNLDYKLKLNENNLLIILIIVLFVFILFFGFRIINSLIKKKVINSSKMDLKKEHKALFKSYYLINKIRK